MNLKVDTTRCRRRCALPLYLDPSRKNLCLTTTGGNQDSYEEAKWKVHAAAGVHLRWTKLRVAPSSSYSDVRLARVGCPTQRMTEGNVSCALRARETTEDRLRSLSRRGVLMRYSRQPLASTRLKKIFGARKLELFACLLDRDFAFIRLSIEAEITSNILLLFRYIT